MPGDPNTKEHDYWFKAKRYGWGWGLPCNLKGWVFFVVWLALNLSVTAYMVYSNRLQHDMMLLVYFQALMLAVMVLVCVWKGEPARWRWGGD